MTIERWPPTVDALPRAAEAVCATFIEAHGLLDYMWVCSLRPETLRGLLTFVALPILVWFLTALLERYLGL